MSRRADVVIPAYRDAELTGACIEAVLEHSGESLGRIIVVDDAGPDPLLRPALRALRARHASVRLLENEQNVGFVESCNRGLSLRQADAVVLNNDTRVTPGWLEELLGVLDADPRIAAASPLSNNATLCAVPDYMGAVSVDAVDVKQLPLAQLPRWTELPTLVGFCMLLRGEVLARIGLFDPAFGRGYNEENDWCQRAQQHGYCVARANRAFVYHVGAQSFGAQREGRDLHNGRRLVARHPTYLEQNRAFDEGPHARIAASAVQLVHAPLRVALAASASSSSTAALLRVLQGQASLRAHFAVADELADAHLVHVLDVPARPEALSRLLHGQARLVFSAPAVGDLVAPEVRPTWAAVEAFRAAAWTLANAADVVIAPSEEAMRELAQRLQVPATSFEVLPMSLGDAGARNDSVLEGLESTFVLAVVDARPVHGLELVLDAYALTRNLGPTPLQLVLVSSAPLESPLPAGVRHVVAVAGARRQLFERARGVVLASRSEPSRCEAELEAEACGVPVIGGVSVRQLAEAIHQAAQSPRPEAVRAPQLDVGLRLATLYRAIVLGEHGSPPRAREFLATLVTRPAQGGT